MQAGKADDSMWELRGMAKDSAAHVIWTCCALKEERKAEDEELARCDAEAS